MIESIKQQTFYTYPAFITNKNNDDINSLVLQLGKKTNLNPQNSKHAIFNYALVNKILTHRENALPALANVLETANDEKQICETLYVIDRMIENNVKGIKKLYPNISRFNDTNSPTVQVYLAGIYRKTLIPDAFGPLMKMMIKNSISPQHSPFDPTEEIGGAILDYLRAKGAVHFYSQNN